MSIWTLLSLTVIKVFTRCKGLRLVVNPPGLQHGVPVHSYFLRMYTSGSLLKVRFVLVAQPNAGLIDLCQHPFSRFESASEQLPNASSTPGISARNN